MKGIWRWASKPVPNVGRIPKTLGDKSNPATSGAPSENDDEDFLIHKCKSVFITKLQSPSDLASRRCSDELVKPTSIMKFDGCTSPPHSLRYLNGNARLDLREHCSRLYDSHIRSVKCFAQQCPEAEFRSHVGSGIKLECLAHMRRRINVNLDLKSSPVVDLAEAEMPPLTQVSPDTHHR